MKLSPDQSENTPPNPSRPSTMDKRTTQTEDTHLLQRALPITLQVTCVWLRRLLPVFSAWTWRSWTFSPCDTEQPQHNIQLCPPREPPSRADPVSETRQDAVSSRRSGHTDVHCRCAGVTLVESVCSDGGENLGPRRAWPPLAQAADIYTLLKYPDDLKYSN